MEVVNISEIKINPNNPRFIKDDKFKSLVKSIKEFPEMLNLRPVVVNKEMIILGGNMRYKACIEAGIKELPIVVADLSEEKQKEFLIKDNLSGGEWDWDILANEWNVEDLESWGLDVPLFNIDEDEPEEEKTYMPTYRFEVSCVSESEKTKLMADLMQKGYSCTDDY